MAAVRSRLPLYLGAGVVGVGGYYMYRAGGRPSIAEKEAERKPSPAPLGDVDSGALSAMIGANFTRDNPIVALS